MPNPISAVAPSETPQAGTKRGLQGNPTTVPRNLPAFRGKKVSNPSNDIKVPGLQQSNKPNRQTNIRIPYSRIAPLEFLSQWSGRLSPGDVAFAQRTPIGFASRTGPKPSTGANDPMAGGRGNPNDARYGNGQQTVSRVIGLDGLNRLLHGATAPGGWVEGVNVFRGPNAYGVVREGDELDDVMDNDPRATNMASLPTTNADTIEAHNEAVFEAANASGPPAGALRSYIREYDGSKVGRFRISLLNDYPLDGVIISNDEPESFTSNGSRDATIFNIAIQGPTLCNNGFLKYTGAASTGPDGARMVEAYPRGSLEVERHIQSASQSTHIASKGGSPWLPPGMYDFVAAFTGGYTSYPQQMFDRQLQPMNELYVGVRAFQLTMTDHTKIVHPDGRGGGTAALETGESFWFYQLMPFSSHKAWLITQMDEALAMPDDGNNSSRAKELDAQGNPLSYYSNKEARAMAISRIDKDGIRHASSTLRAPFDADPFDAVRSADLHNLIGAWRVGRVMDIKAMRYSAYDGGPADTGFATTVDVQVAWQSARSVESLYQGDAADRARDYRNDRNAMYAISQPTGMRGRDPTAFHPNAGYDKSVKVPDSSMGLDKKDSLRYIPRKRLRREDAVHSRPSLAAAVGRSVGRSLFSSPAGTFVRLGTAGVDTVDYEYMRMPTTQSRSAWLSLLRLVSKNKDAPLYKASPVPAALGQLFDKLRDPVEHEGATQELEAFAQLPIGLAAEALAYNGTAEVNTMREHVLKSFRLNDYQQVRNSTADDAAQATTLASLFTQLDQSRKSGNGDGMLDYAEFAAWFGITTGAAKQLPGNLAEALVGMQRRASVAAPTDAECEAMERSWCGEPDSSTVVGQATEAPMEVELGDATTSGGASGSGSGSGSMVTSAEQSLGSSWSSLDDAGVGVGAPAASMLDAEVAAALSEPSVGQLPPPLQPTPAPTSAPTSASAAGKAPVRKVSPARARKPAAAASATASTPAGSIGVASVAAASQPARSRNRPATTSTVASVFDSIFGDDASQPAQPHGSPGSVSSGSEHGAGAGGPKTFQRRGR